MYAKGMQWKERKNSKLCANVVELSVLISLDIVILSVH